MKALYQVFFGGQPREGRPITFNRVQLAIAGPLLNPIHILVKNLEGEILEVLAGSESTVEQVKHLIHDYGGMPLNMQRLILARRQMEDGRALGYYHIQDNTMLHLVSRLVGC